MATKPTTKKFLPIVIGSVGGLSPAGRSGGHHAFSFLMREVLNQASRKQSVVHQARLMNLISWQNSWVEYATQKQLTAEDVFQKYDPSLSLKCFIRKPTDPVYFDPYECPILQEAFIEEGDVLWPREQVPKNLPAHLMVIGEDPEKRLMRLRLSKESRAFFRSSQRLEVSCAGLIPDGVSLEATGFGEKSHRIPRNIKLALFGASDCMKSLGIGFEEILSVISHDQVGIYVGSCMGQSEEKSPESQWRNLLRTENMTSTALPFSFSNMPADFIAGYLLGSLGRISCDVAACATFLYNLYNAIADIRSGQIQFAIVGASDAPVSPGIMTGYNSMGALAKDTSLASLPNGDLNRAAASIPFGENFGFTLAEGSQFITLFHPDLALNLGIEPMGGVAGVFCHSDGWKDSITRPGLGNYITFGKALTQAENLFGKKLLQRESFISAHGSSTPLNRKTESKMLDDFAALFKIQHWPVTAIKSFVGHTLGAASGDQVMALLGTFATGWLPKIQNLKTLGSDVSHRHLHFLTQHEEKLTNLAFVNSKGFGGHNATGVFISPKILSPWLKKRAGRKGYASFEKKSLRTAEKRQAWEEAYLKGAQMIHYHADRCQSEKEIVSLSRQGIKLKGVKKVIPFL